MIFCINSCDLVNLFDGLKKVVFLVLLVSLVAVRVGLEIERERQGRETSDETNHFRCVINSTAGIPNLEYDSELRNSWKREQIGWIVL